MNRAWLRRLSLARHAARHPSGARRALPGRHLLAVAGAVLLGGAAVAGCQPATAVPTPPPVTSSPSAASIWTATSTTTAPATTTTTALLLPPPPPPAPETTHALPPRTTQAAPPPVNSGGTACGADSYVNSDGNCVHRPVQAPAPPAGATARCRDGSYSFSQHRSGTCSGHGGVAEWL
ncbi:DUF3761 domain-containing protein [Gandjariella thermophila]|uniref:DUF3761 domain-containing protein n=1 Tax=Gandjariella thermophila TaxID=1931992 RepID=A0A4D4J9L0_9PSEU|nr:DUF3761 domain-containing protein [Gandjariella thermophila]GDY33351.1 hypothetical protein GTS_49840 [Gandjariella thermophila]